MTGNTKNKSVIKTEKALRKAFCEFLREDGYYIPTVQQLTQRAEISKTTFYRRHPNIEDFIESEISFAVRSVCDNVQWFEKALENRAVSAKEVVFDMKKNDTTIQLIQAFFHSQFIYDYSIRLMNEINRLYNEKDYVKAMSPEKKKNTCCIFYLFCRLVI
ncbi:MAG: TetR/AcrR family transcriptional regulator [Acutalibacteraceae bacterium]